ncbi:MAG: alpha/beta fold hydrolase [Butyrivibrio sp.]
MVIKKEFNFLSRNGRDKCHACSWEPEKGQIKAVFQIVHGMQEYVKRYDTFATFLAEEGFLVVGADHLGHGLTAATDKDLGYFTEKDAPTILVRDVHRLKKMIQEEHPGIPYFIMGHSMGSFILRKYLAMYGKGIDGAILISTGYQPAIVTSVAIFFTNFIRIFHGDRYKSRFITGLAFGSYLKRIPDARTSSDWLTKDDDIIKTYRADKYCTFKFSLNAYRALFGLVRFACNPRNLTKISKELPIFLISGEEDPVGNYGKGVVKVYEQFRSLGIKDVEIKLYPDCRHEILNESNKEEVYNDILNWINSHINQ